MNASKPGAFQARPSRTASVRRSCCCKPSSSSATTDNGTRKALWNRFKTRCDRIVKLVDEAARPVAEELHEFAKEDAKGLVDKVTQATSGSGDSAFTSPTSSDVSSSRREWKEAEAVVDAE
jgi:hypothetical protein